MILKVLQIHINVSGSLCTDCVIATAMNDVLKPEYKAFVGATASYIMKADKVRHGKMEDRLHTIFHSERLKKYIQNFDAYNEAEPGEFEIDIPTSYLRAS